MNHETEREGRGAPCRTSRSLFATALLALSLLAFHVGAQTNPRTFAFAGGEPKPLAPGSAAAADTNAAVRAEQIRAACVAGRRCVCGRVLKVLPGGLVVESGYTNLLRKALEGAWLLPGTVLASRAPNLVESPQPDSPCVGTVFITDLPRPRGGGKVKVKPYDYVVLQGYSAGQYTYSSVGGIQRTVRRFSAGLETAIKLNLETSEKSELGKGPDRGRARSADAY